MEDIFHLGVKALLRNNKGEILLLKVNPEMLNKERNNYWDLPGGRVQKSDSVLDTLRREVEEETGITDITNPKEVGMVLANIRIPLKEKESAGLILAVYACDAAPDADIALSDEHIAYDWFAPKEAAERLNVKYPPEFCDMIARL